MRRFTRRRGGRGEDPQMRRASFAAMPDITERVYVTGRSLHDDSRKADAVQRCLKLPCHPSRWRDLRGQKRRAGLLPRAA